RRILVSSTEPRNRPSVPGRDLRCFGRDLVVPANMAAIFIRMQEVSPTAISLRNHLSGSGVAGRDHCYFAWTSQAGILAPATLTERPRPIREFVPETHSYAHFSSIAFAVN